MRQLLPGPGRSLDDRAEIEEAYAPSRPQILRTNFVVSLDGAVELDGRSAALGGPGDLAVFASLRALSDAVLVGASTARIENYGPARVKPEARHRRLARRQPPLPTVVVVTASGDLDPASRLFTERVEGVVTPRPVILTCSRAPIEARQQLAEVAEVVVCGEDSVDLPAGLAALRERGLANVICEGGPVLFSSLLGAGLVDELCLSQAAVLAGPGHRLLHGPAYSTTAAQVPGEGTRWGEPSRWTLTFLAEEDGMLFARYRSVRAGSEPG